MTVEQFERLNPEFVARIEKEQEEEFQRMWEKIPKNLTPIETLRFVKEEVERGKASA